MINMVQTYKIPWGAWHRPEKRKFEFPDQWDISYFEMKGAPEITDIQKIEDRIDDAIGVSKIETIAEDKKDATIIVDDISRPTKAEKIVSILLDKLNDSGIQDEDITIITAIGAHRPMYRDDLIKKIGLENINRVNVENHHPYENLEFIGESRLGTPIYINRTYYQADLKIAIGSVIPHPLAGFGGGAKMILPGISGIKTLEANHSAGLRGIGIGIGRVTELRKDIEDVCKKVGLDFSINIVNTMNRGIAGIFSGHFIEAHRKAIQFAKEVYLTEIPRKSKFDIAFLNLHPEDSELSQSVKGFNIILSTRGLLHRKSGVIFLTASPEGRGYHSLLGEKGSKLYKNWGNHIIWKAAINKRKFGIFSPNLTKYDVNHFFPKTTIFHRNFDEMIKTLEEIYGDSPRAVLFPSSIQLTAEI
ncbi:MAG: DUF2088 domain-containing protein [Candidatus Lokiarchaeota archaeon]|nr:DUF2088 domain-containing protein [Candidatus Lokiarchaeota archaeon]